MSNPNISLGKKVNNLETKAEKYKKYEDYEATKNKYTDRLSSLQRSLQQLKYRLEDLEFYSTVCTDIINEELPRSAEDASRNAQEVSNKNVDDLWELVDNNRTDQYEQKIQQARSEISDAKGDIEDLIRDFEDSWQDTIESAREIQKLVGESKKRNRAMNEIEYFVSETVRDSSKDINKLKHDWSELLKTWKEVEIDWDQFQDKHGLSDETIDLLQALAEGDELTFDHMTDDVAEEILTVSELKKVLKITI